MGDNARRCNCKTCEYGKKIQALIARQTSEEDKKELDRLYESFCLLEDDVCLYRGRWRDTVPLLCVIRKDHFRQSMSDIRLDGHEGCTVCDLLEKVY